jgi:hypothetical protein
MRMILSTAEIYSESLSDDRAMAYIEALIDVPIEDLGLGIQRHIRTSKWFPKPAELREAVRPTSRPRTSVRTCISRPSVLAVTTRAGCSWLSAPTRRSPRSSAAPATRGTRSWSRPSASALTRTSGDEDAHVPALPH